MKVQIHSIRFPKKLILGAFFAVVIFFGSRTIAKEFLTVSASVSAAPETSVPVAAVPQVEPEKFHSAAVSHRVQPDRALTLYRSEESRSDVLWFYSHITGNSDIASIILEYASLNNIAPSLAFALAWEESRYQPKAVNSNITSVDRGLFQLNNKSFPYLTEKDFFDPEMSAKYGLQHLYFCMDTAGNEVSALAMYNAGTTKVRNNNTPQRTLDYVSRILNYRRGLDELFESEVAARYEINQSGIVALASIR